MNDTISEISYCKKIQQGRSLLNNSIESFYKMFGERFGYGLRAGVDVEFFVDMLHMIADRFVTDEEDICDLPIIQTLDEIGKYFLLPFR